MTIFYNVPEASPHFVHRSSTGIFSKNKTICIEGMPGIGKTELALQYAHEMHSKYNANVFWINKKDADRNNLLISLAPIFDVDEDLPKDIQNDVVMNKIKNLATSQRVFIFFDGFEESILLNLLWELMRNVTIVSTSRERSVAQERVILGMLSKQESHDLVGKVAGRFVPTADLVDIVEGYPLALVHAGKFLRDSNNTMKDFVRSIQSDSYWEWPQRGDKENNYAHVWYNYFHSFGQRTKETWIRIASLAPASISHYLWHSLNGTMDKATLKERHLIEASEKSFRMPLIVRTAARKVSDIRAGGKMWEKFHKMFAELSVPDELSFCLDSLPHFEHLYNKRKWDVIPLRYISPLCEILSAAGRFQEAYDILDRALKKPHKDDAPNSLQNLNAHVNKANLLKQIGGHNTMALNRIKDALKMLEGHHPQQTEDIAKAKITYANMLRKGAGNRVPKALKIIDEVLSFDISQDTQWVAQVAKSTLLAEKGDLEEAHKYLETTAAHMLLSLEASHPYLATAKMNLALILMDQGQTEEAREMLKAVDTSLNEHYDVELPIQHIIRGQLRLK